MDVARRLKFGLAALVALCASAVFVAPAAADTQPDPQLSNVPYLAWRGEQVRLVKCEPGLFGNDAVIAQQNGFHADWLLVDWSGDPHLIAPQLEPGTVSFFSRSWDGAPCAAATFTSQKAGIAQIKLVISEGGTAILKHDFLVAWMNIGSVVLSEAGGSNPLPAGNDSFNQLRVDVTGNFPLMQNYTELGIGDSITLPADWPTLARALATDRGPLTPDPSLLWDIHDDQLTTEGHGTNTQTICTDELIPGGTIDAVDNCNGGGDSLGFSRIWSGETSPTIGPFDPQRAGQTLLSDGKLDAGDAPMPALRIDFGIAPNTPGGINGVGFFREVDKRVTYSRDGLGTFPLRHNFYAPFYFRYIPATDAIEEAGIFEASGTDGPTTGNNFNGYLWGNEEGEEGAYLFWEIAEVLGTGPGGLSDCAQFVNPDTSPDVLRPLPSGPQRVVVYTDEHGEARIEFIAGLEFFFDVFGVLNANGGCDLGGVTNLGTAEVTATARYPYQPVTAQPVTSNPITKTVTSLFEKSITCYPKGPGAQNAIAAICVAHAQDIDGSPFVGETICFLADFNAMDIQFFNGVINGIDLSGTTQTTDPRGLRRICVITDANGNAAVEVFNSNPTVVDVTAFFVDEGILRSVKVPFPITQPVSGSTSATQNSPTPTGGSPNGTTGTNRPQGNQPQGNQPAANTPGVVYRVASVRLVRQTRIKAYAMVRVAGPAGKVKLRIRISARNQRTTALRTVRTGRVVKVPNLRTPRFNGRLRVSAAIVS